MEYTRRVLHDVCTLCSIHVVCTLYSIHDVCTLCSVHDVCTLYSVHDVVRGAVYTTWYALTMTLTRVEMFWHDEQNMRHCLVVYHERAA